MEKVEYNVWQQRVMEILIQFNIGIEHIYSNYWDVAWKMVISLKSSI